MKNLTIIFLVLCITSFLMAQISFKPEFGVYKIIDKDALINLALFSPDSTGEFIYAAYSNKYPKVIRVVKYDFGGTVLEQKTFPLLKSEEFINGKIFKSQNKTYYLALTTFTADTVLTTNQLGYVEITSSNYLSLKLYDFDNKQLLDSIKESIGNNYKYIYIEKYKKLGKLNFINIPFQNSEPTNIYIGMKFNIYYTPGFNEYRSDTTALYKISVHGDKIIAINKTDKCGNDFYLSGNTIFSSGFAQSSFRDYEEYVHYILKSDDEFSSTETHFSLIGGKTIVKYDVQYVKFILNFKGLFNNFPENSEYSPLYWYNGLDTYNLEFDGPYFVLWAKDLSRIKDYIYGGFWANSMQDAHTYIKLRDSSDALLYFTKDGSITTSWVRKVSDGKLIYFDSHCTMVPSYILKSRTGKHYFFKTETSGLTAYVLEGGTITTIDPGDQNLSPGDYELKQNYPNPFNGSTKITYVLPTQSFVELKIFDILGNEVTALVSKEQNPGEHTITFEASSLPSGIYIYTIQAGNYRSSKKFLLMK